MKSGQSHDWSRKGAVKTVTDCIHVYVPGVGFPERTTSSQNVLSHIISSSARRRRRRSLETGRGAGGLLVPLAGQTALSPPGCRWAGPRTGPPCLWAAVPSSPPCCARSHSQSTPTDLGWGNGSRMHGCMVSMLVNGWLMPSSNTQK